MLLKGATSSPQILAEQIDRYAADKATPPSAYGTYIDGALLVQRDAAQIFDAWLAEYFQPHASDRDQPAFAYSMAKAQIHVHTVTCASVRAKPIASLTTSHWDAGKRSGLVTLAGARVNDHSARPRAPADEETQLCHWNRDESVAKLVRNPMLHSSSSYPAAAARAASNATPAQQRVCPRRWGEAQIASFMSDHPQRAYFSYLMRLAGLSFGMEVGVADGRYSELFLQHGVAPDTWIMVEPYPNVQLLRRANVHAYDSEPPASALEASLEGATTWSSRGLGNRTRMVFLKGLSSEQHVLRFVQKHSLDFIYLDGAHDYDNVKQEMIDYWPRLRPGGVLAGHDYCNWGEGSLPCKGCSDIPRCRPYTSHGVAHGKPEGKMSANQEGVVRAVQEWLVQHQPGLRLYHTSENFTRESLAADSFDYDLVLTNSYNPSWFVVKPPAPAAEARGADHVTSDPLGGCSVEVASCGVGRLVPAWRAGAIGGGASPGGRGGLQMIADCARERGMDPRVSPRSNATSTTDVTLALIYYASPALLLRHLAVVGSYAPNVRSRLHLLIIDDGSPAHLDAASYISARVRRELSGAHSLTIARIEQDLTWNIGGARNLAFHLAPTPRVLLLDLDTPAPPAMIAAVLGLSPRVAVNSPAGANAGVPIAHRFNRLRPTGEHKLSPAAVLMSPASYWAAGGCDEDFVGNYGWTDVHFWHRAAALPSSELAVQRHTELSLVELSAPPSACDGVHPRWLLERCTIAADAHAASRESVMGSARENVVNGMLFRWKRRTGRWSNEYLRFSWSMALSLGATDLA